ncbi:hypothetical protein EDB86DRAFT_2018864 [Lactarius hatsudake]|nr:hypothetical protein EDB86DRAFT_2018864 [Lactarius hatsudake]
MTRSPSSQGVHLVAQTNRYDRRLWSRKVRLPYLVGVARQGEVFVVFWNVKRLGEGTDREIEGFLNLVFTHLLNLWLVNSFETRCMRQRCILTSLTAESTINLASSSSIRSHDSTRSVPVYDTLVDPARENDELPPTSRSDSRSERPRRQKESPSSTPFPERGGQTRPAHLQKPCLRRHGLLRSM